MNQRPNDREDPAAAGGAESPPSVFRWKWLFRLVLAGYWVALFLATHLPVPKGIQQEVSAFDKSIHAAAYSILAALLALSCGWPRLSARRLMALALVVVGYAAFDEWLQTRVGRFGDVRDWMSDVTGGICTLLLAWGLQRVFARGAGGTSRAS